MIRNKLASTFVWAGGTFALALVIGLPATTNAVDDANSPGLVAKAVTPRLAYGGIELSVASKTPSTQPSDASAKHPLELVVTAVNKTDDSVTGKFDIQLDSASVTDPRSRTLPQPTQIWADSGSMKLGAGESKTFTFTPSSVPADKMLRVNMHMGNQTATMLSLAPRKSGALTELR